MQLIRLLKRYRSFRTFTAKQGSTFVTHKAVYLWILVIYRVGWAFEQGLASVLILRGDPINSVKRKSWCFRFFLTNLLQRNTLSRKNLVREDLFPSSKGRIYVRPLRCLRWYANHLITNVIVIHAGLASRKNESSMSYLKEEEEKSCNSCLMLPDCPKRNDFMYYSCTTCIFQKPAE